MERTIKNKMKLLSEMSVLTYCTEKDIDKLKNAKSEVELDNIAHSLIMKYL